MVITSSGIIIRTPVEQISIVGLITRGVKIINIGDGDSGEYRAGRRTNDEPTDGEIRRRRGSRRDANRSDDGGGEGATLQARLSVLNHRGWILLSARPLVLQAANLARQRETGGRVGA